MSAATRSRRAPRTPDRLCAEAVDLARSAVEDAAGHGNVGDWIEAVADGDRLVTHLFECREPGYRGWRWAATLARASRARVVTLDETVLVPGPDALTAPQWVPWSERLRPGDLGPGDLLPTESDDLRLEPGFSGEDSPPPNSPLAEEAAAEEAGHEGEATSPVDARGRIGSLAEELGMSRARVLSRYGLHAAADRWEETHGSRSPMAQAAPATCVTCGFLVPLAGSLRQAFGVCANEYSPADGQVVSLTFGCGGHSEAAVMPKPPQPPPPVIDETRADLLPLGDERPADPGTADAGTARTGTADAGTARTGTADAGTAQTGTAETGTAQTGTAGATGGEGSGAKRSRGKGARGKRGASGA